MRSFETLGHNGQVRRLKRLGLAALAEYPLPIVRLAPLVHLENTTFRAEDTDGGRYVLRISRPGKHTLEEVRSEMAWLAALRRDTCLAAPEPMATHDGALATMTAMEEVPEPRICVLFRRVEGRFLNAGLTPNTCSGWAHLPLSCITILSHSLHPPDSPVGGWAKRTPPGRPIRSAGWLRRARRRMWR